MEPTQPELDQKHRLLKQVNFWYAMLLVTVIAAALTFLLLSKINTSYQYVAMPQATSASKVISDPTTLLKDFSYNGKPINPNCLTPYIDLEEIDQTTVDVSTCENIEKAH
jgi:hypothetical protein